MTALGDDDHDDFEVPVGRDGLLVYLRVGGRKMLFDGRQGWLVGRVGGELESTLDRIAAEGGTLGDAAVDALVAERLRLPGATRPDLELPALAPSGITIYPAAQCNMACSYCYNTQGTYNGKHDVGLMSADTVEAVIRWYDDLRTPHPLSVTLIGGEPTVNGAATDRLARHFLETEGRNRPEKLYLMTNGLHLPRSLLDLFERHPGRAVMGFSLDGDRARNDANRRDAGGHGTFDRVLANLREADSRGIRYMLIAVVPPPFAFVEAFDELRALGVKTITLRHGDIPVFNLGQVPPGEFDAQFQAWRRGYLAYNRMLLAELAKGDIAVATDRGNALKGIFEGYDDEPFSCDAGQLSLAVSPDGGIYPCSRFLPHRDFLLGDVRTGVTAEGIDRFHDLLRNNGRLRLEHRQCRVCYVQAVCRGGCYGNNVERHGSIDAIIEENCRRKRQRTAIDLYYMARLAEEFPERFARLGGVHA